MHSEIVTPDEMDAICAHLPVPLWNSAVAREAYGATLDVACHDRAGRPVGIWVCPRDGAEDAPAVRRPARLLPYASPWVEPSLHSADRHRVVMSLVRAVMERTVEIDLPMDPWFAEVAALSEAGATVRGRHTRVLDVAEPRDARSSYGATARNHVKAASRRHTIVPMAPEEFDFSRAVVGQPPEAVTARRRSGLLASRAVPTLCLGAVDEDAVCRGQVFVLTTGGAAVLMHSWFDRSGTRGVPSLLVDAAVHDALAAPDVAHFDFEGSVIPSIDAFMTSFGARCVPYAHVQWRRGDETRQSEFG